MNFTSEDFRNFVQSLSEKDFNDFIAALLAFRNARVEGVGTEKADDQKTPKFIRCKIECSTTKLRDMVLIRLKTLGYTTRTISVNNTPMKIGEERPFVIITNEDGGYIVSSNIEKYKNMKVDTYTAGEFIAKYCKS